MRTESVEGCNCQACTSVRWAEALREEKTEPFSFGPASTGEGHAVDCASRTALVTESGVNYYSPPCDCGADSRAREWAEAAQAEKKEPFTFGPGKHDSACASLWYETDCNCQSAESRIKQSNPKDAIGSKKPPHSTVSQAVMAEVGVGMLEGSIKYGRHNYRAIGVRAEVYYDAARRHMDSWWEGEDIDPDSGLHHVTKAICSLVVLRDAMIQGKLFDDRPPPTPPEHKQYVTDKTAEVFKRYEGKQHERPYIKGGRMGEAPSESESADWWKTQPAYAGGGCECKDCKEYRRERSEFEQDRRRVGKEKTLTVTEEAFEGLRIPDEVEIDDMMAEAERLRGSQLSSDAMAAAKKNCRHARRGPRWPCSACVLKAHDEETGAILR